MFHSTVKKVAATCQLLLTLLLVFLSGCKDASKAPPVVDDVVKDVGTTIDGKNIEELSANTAGANQTPANVKVELASFEELKQRIATYKDRVVVVDAWSTSCLPCMKEFPHLVELARRWPEDLVCISVNLDYVGLPNTAPKDCLPEVTNFLRSKGADLNNLVNLVSTDTDEQMYAKLEIASIPSIFVYDRSGAQAGKLTVDSAGADGLTYAGDVVPLVEKLIEK